MKLIKLLSVVIVTLVITNVTLTNRSVDQSLLVSTLSGDITTLENELVIARARVAHLSAISTLEPQLRAAGFVETPKIVALPTPSWVALR